MTFAATAGRLRAAFLLAVMVGCLSCLSFAQGARWDNFTWTTVNVGASATTAIVPIAGATITICNSPAVMSGGVCTNKATTYTDATLTVACASSSQVVLNGTSSCRATSDSQGNFGFWAASGQTLTYTISGSGITSQGPFTITLPILGGATLSVCSLNGVKFVDTANSCAWSGTDVGGWINAALTALGSSYGKVHVSKGSYSFSTQINADLSVNATIEGDGGVTSGADAATKLIWTAAGTPIVGRSTTGLRISNIQFEWNNASFAGPYMDFSHTGTGCGGSGCDASQVELDHLSFFKTGSGVNVPLISLDKNINCSVHDNSLHNFATYAIRGGSGSGSYSNVCHIIHNTASTSTGDSSGNFILNPGQAWDVISNTVELGISSGTLNFAATTSGFIVSGFKASANWAGDANAGTAYTLFDFSASGSGGAGGIDVSGGNYFALTLTSTYLKLPNSSQVKFEGNSVADCSKLLDLGTADAVDVGTANSFTGTCTTLYGTNNPSKGFGVNAAGNPVVFGNVQFPSTLNAGAGSVSTAAVGVGATNTGWFSNSNTALQETFGGIAGATFTNSTISLPTALNLSWASQADPNAGSNDTNLSKVTVGVVGVGTGAQGSTAGEIRSSRIAATYNAAGTLQTTVHLVEDTCTLGTNCAVTLTGSAAFSSGSSYRCTASDATAANAVRVNQTSGSAVTFTGTGTDVINYTCIGN